jgi:hypothetical protein
MKRLFAYILVMLSSFISCATTENLSPAIQPSTPSEKTNFSETNSKNPELKGPGAVCFIRIDNEGEITGVKATRDYPYEFPLLSEVVQELLRGPTDSEKEDGLITLIPPGTKLLSQSFRGSTLYLSLSEDFRYNRNGKLGYQFQLVQLTETLKEFPVNDVQILIEGKRIDYLDFSREYSIGSPLPVNSDADSRAWLVEQKEIQENRKKIFIAERKINTPIFVSIYYTEKPNSANGVNCSIQFMNISDKRIKYVYFTVTPYNRVDDVAYSEIGRLSTTELEVVNYINPDDLYRANWESVWYNSTIAYMKMSKIRIIFDDNSTSTIEGRDALDKAILTPEEYENFSLF